jgi:hypothetical protein
MQYNYFLLVMYVWTHFPFIVHEGWNAEYNLICGAIFQVYYDMYEKSKEKYAVEMQLYSSRTKPPGDDIPTC